MDTISVMRARMRRLPRGGGNIKGNGDFSTYTNGVQNGKVLSSTMSQSSRLTSLYDGGVASGRRSKYPLVALFSNSEKESRGVSVHFLPSPQR